jgi:phytoene/squalene synthetase
MRRGRHEGATDALDQFTRTAETAANDVIGSYSTSFGLATRLLGPRHRQHVRNIYAMVRVADEIVDGVAAEAGLDRAGQAAALAAYEADAHRAIRTGYSSDLVLHAFARTARESSIGETLTQPFFDSMRADLGSADAASGPREQVFDASAHEAYVHGSAEVVGLMCLQVFLRDDSPTDAELEVLRRGACRLGAAFQNVNFLRDLSDDTERLGRDYLGGGSRLTDAERDAWVATIREQLADAAAAIPLLPRDARAAVRSAHALFQALTDRVAHTPTEQLYRTRVRVSDPAKARLAAGALFTTWREVGA